MAADRPGTSQPGAKAPNLILRRIREQERHETREEFADAMARAARETGEGVSPDAKYVAKLETGDIKYPRPTYRRILADLCGRPFGELGFNPPPGLSLPGEDTQASDTGNSGLAISATDMNVPLRNAVMASGLEFPQIARKVGVDPKTVQRWITRGVVPHARHRWKVSEILQLDEAELWPSTTMADQKSVAPVTFGSASPDHSNEYTPEDEERIILAARRPRRYDPAVADALAAVLSGQRRTEDAVGSAILIEPVKAQFAVVHEVVTEARGDLRTKILDIGSQWSQFAGWLHASTGQLDTANRYYGLALEWAVEADKPDMIATALNMQGHTAWLSAKPGPIIGLSRAAQRDNRISPGVRALAVQQEARGIALSGEAGISDIDRRFDNAEELAAHVAEKPENEPPWIYFFSPDYLILQRGLAYRLLGEYSKANDLLQSGLSAIPAEMRKTEWVASHYLIQLAVNHAKSGDVLAACSVAREINTIARHTDSSGLQKTLARFQARLRQKWPDDPHVNELAENLG